MNVSAHNLSNNNLNHVLHSFQLFAMNALGGPSLWNAEMAKLAGANFESYKALLETLQSQSGKETPTTQQLPFDFKLPAPLHTQSSPIFLRPDSQCEKGECVLEGKSIACFEIGGEKRLCLPQLLQTVLGKFSLEVINQACDYLNIYCSRCSPEQLDLFKRTGNLPSSAPTCGLITLTDAERLCASLLYKETDPQSNNNNYSQVDSASIPVYHECFGEGYGYFKPNLYSSPDATCIECAECFGLFSTKRFIGHSHKSNESGLCHWGFDRNNWKTYLLFAEEAVKDKAECANLEEIFNRTINRFGAEKNMLEEPIALKRKASVSPEEQAKSRRFSDSHVTVHQGLVNGWMTSPPLTFPLRGAFTSNTPTPTKMRLPSQRSCPPTLENPDRVVPSCESNRYEKHFVPNIALQQGDSSHDAAVKIDEDEGIDIKKEELDSEESLGNCPLNQENVAMSPGSATPSSTYTVLECLAKMEYQYLELLESSSLTPFEKNRLEQKYVSYSDSIRKEFQQEEFSCQMTEEGNIDRCS